MRIDRSHRQWFFISVGILILATATYFTYGVNQTGGPRGDSALGLAYGAVAMGMILFPGILGLRKKLLLLRIGSLAWWMKGHLWLGALSLPMVLYHGAFEFGGPLTTAMMVLLIIIVVSGAVGAVLQHVVPGVMTAQAPGESTYELLDRAFGHLRREAFELVWSACGEAPRKEEEDSIKSVIGEAPKKPKTNLMRKPGGLVGQDQLLRFYDANVRPFLTRRQAGRTPLVTASGAALMFDVVRVELHPDLHETLDDLADVCTEARQKIRQIQLHRWLHVWLLLHIPLSLALLVLMTVHAFVALYY